MVSGSDTLRVCLHWKNYLFEFFPSGLLSNSAVYWIFNREGNRWIDWLFDAPWCDIAEGQWRGPSSLDRDPLGHKGNETVPFSLTSLNKVNADYLLYQQAGRETHLHSQNLLPYKGLLAVYQFTYLLLLTVSSSYRRPGPGPPQLDCINHKRP